MTKLHHAIVVELRQAARESRERALVRTCNRYLRGLGEDDAADRRTLAAACWRLLGKEVTP